MKATWLRRSQIGPGVMDDHVTAGSLVWVAIYNSRLDSWEVQRNIYRLYFDRTISPRDYECWMTEGGNGVESFHIDDHVRVAKATMPAPPKGKGLSCVTCGKEHAGNASYEREFLTLRGYVKVSAETNFDYCGKCQIERFIKECKDDCIEVAI